MRDAKEIMVVVADVQLVFVYVPYTVLGPHYASIHLIPMSVFEVGNIIIPILNTRKMNHRNAVCCLF